MEALPKAKANPGTVGVKLKKRVHHSGDTALSLVALCVRLCLKAMVTVAEVSLLCGGSLPPASAAQFVLQKENEENRVPSTCTGRMAASELSERLHG